MNINQRFSVALALAAVLPLSAWSSDPNTAAIVLSVKGSVMAGKSVFSDAMPHQVKLLDPIYKDQSLQIGPGSEVVVSFALGGARLKLNTPQKVVIEPYGIKGRPPLVAAGKTGPGIPIGSIGSVETTKMGGVSGRALAAVYSREPQPVIDLGVLPESSSSGVTKAFIRDRRKPDAKWRAVAVRLATQPDGRKTFQPTTALKPGPYDLNLDHPPDKKADYYILIFPHDGMKEYDALAQRAHASDAHLADRMGFIEYLRFYNCYDDALNELAAIPSNTVDASLRASLRTRLENDRKAFNRGVGG